MNNEDFRQQLSSQFAAVTGETKEDSEQILFENKTFNAFDFAYREPKLDLVRSQLKFFESGVLANDNDNAELLKEMLVEAQQTIFDYSIQLLKNRSITKDEFKKRAMNFIKATTNKALKEQATAKAERIVGEELTSQYI